VLHVRRQFIRRIPLSEEMTRELVALRPGSRYPSDVDRCSRQGTASRSEHRNATRRGFELAAAKAGIDGVTFDSMRHAFASWVIDRGITSTVLAALMGSRARSLSGGTSICSKSTAFNLASACPVVRGG
jgi:integrase